MFLALIVLVVAAIAAAAVVSKVIKSVISTAKSGADGEPSKEEEKTGKKTPVKTEVVEDNIQKKESLSEELNNRFAAARRAGITESFWNEKTDFSIDSKAFADKCVSGSVLSYLEVNNRAMAGKDFMGFNVMIEQGEKMTLTYQGLAIATLTRLEKTVTETVDGKEVSKKVTFYRTNTFPPHLSSKMIPADLERMLQASTSIIACNGNPEQISERILDIFSESENVLKLKENIDSKIQAKESIRAQPKEIINKRSEHKITR